MAIRQMNPYLNFNGDASDAIKLYERVLGATIQNIQRFKDVPGDAPKPENAERVIHAVLQIGSGIVMVSDGSADMKIPRESNVHLCLDFDDPADQTAKFEGLAQGGQVTMPLQDTFWGARFGMLIDRYGIHWMLNCEKKS